MSLSDSQPERAVVELVQAADVDAGGGEQHHGERELADDEQLAEALVRATAGGATRHSSTSG